MCSCAYSVYRPSMCLHHLLTSHSSKGIKRKATAIMLVAIIIMWLSTLAFWIVTLVAAVKAYSVLQVLTAQTSGHIANMQACLTSMTGSDSAYSCSSQDPLTELAGTEAYYAEDCTGTVSLMINVCPSV